MAIAPRTPAPANGAAVFMAKPDEEELDPVALAPPEELPDPPALAAELEADEAAEAALPDALATAPLTEDEADERAEAPEALAAEAAEAAEAEAAEAAEAADPVKEEPVAEAAEPVAVPVAPPAVADEQ